MTERELSLSERLAEILGERIVVLAKGRDRIPTLEVDVDHWVEVARMLRDEDRLHFEQLTDLAGVDYLYYGKDEWETEDASFEGFSRGVQGRAGPGRFDWEERPQIEMERRYAVVLHALSLQHNWRVRVRCFAPDGQLPVLPSLIDVWAAANWYEREAFDLYGIIFEGHPDMRRILTDYGFVGHPFRKDFPLIGNVEMRYDVDKGRVVYQPVSIEPRVLVPKVIRRDSRYGGEGKDHG